MPITVPKPITDGIPQFWSGTSHTPYNTAQAAWNANQNFSGTMPAPINLPTPLPIGTVLGMSQPVVPKPAATTGIGNTPAGYYAPADPRVTQNYLGLLKSGYTVDPNTGKAGMSTRGLAGGQLGAGPTGYRGTIDPVAARAAIQQFQQQYGGQAVYGPGGYIRPGYNANTGQQMNAAVTAPQVPSGPGMIDTAGYNAPTQALARAQTAIQQALDPMTAVQGKSGELINNALGSYYGNVAPPTPSPSGFGMNAPQYNAMLAAQPKPAAAPTPSPADAMATQFKAAQQANQTKAEAYQQYVNSLPKGQKAIPWSQFNYP